MRPWLERRDAWPLAGLFALALAANVAVAVAAARGAGVPLAWLGVFFDGSIYLEIAKSFPLPYAPGGPDYPSHAPGYPALIYLASLLTPLSWGLLALLASWLPAALAPLVFYAVCRDLGLAPFWPSALFALANPRWLSVASTAHAESLAMLLVLLALAASLRRRLGAAVVCLSLAVATRYPALLLALPLAYVFLVARREWRTATFAWLSLPLLAFALLNLYYALRIPGFQSLQHTHEAFWETGLTWPFAEFVAKARTRLGGEPVPNFAFANTWLVLYLVACAVGFRRERGELRLLPVWIAVLVLVHVSLRGDWTVWDFPRLVLLAWPAALLIGWRWLGTRLPAAAAALCCALLGAVSFAWATRTVADAVRWQYRTSPFPAQGIRRLHADEPQWLDFRGFAAEAKKP